MPVQQHNPHLINRLPDAIKDVYFRNDGIGFYGYENDVPVILKYWNKLKELKEVLDNFPFEEYKEGLFQGFELGYKSNELFSLEDNKRQMVKKAINCPGFPIKPRESTYFKNEDVHEYGVTVGVNYWIWKQILESPEPFETIFVECSKSKDVESSSQSPASTKSRRLERAQISKSKDVESSSQSPTSTKSRRLRMAQIALVCIYEGLHISQDNAKSIALKYGYSSKTSGIKLCRKYNMYCRSMDRQGNDTPLKIKNKLELIESVKLLLDESLQHKAEEDIKKLRTIINDN